jgi:hypothetical protein
MSACEGQTFLQITPTLWERVKVELAKSHGVTGPIADNGTFAGGAPRYEITWKYDPTAQTLHVQMLDSPWYASCASITQAISEEIAKIRSTP